MTDGTMLRIEALDRILDADPASGLVKVEAGIRLRDLNDRLDELGLALENMGDIDTQTIAGAISTATHGTGAGLRNISAQVEAVELVLGDGSLRQLGRDSGSLLQAARVGVGALGALASVTLRCVPEFTLHRIDQPLPIDAVLADFHERAAANDHFEFFVFPYTETALTIRRNRTDRAPDPRNPVINYLNEVVLENRVSELLLQYARMRPSSIPRLARGAARLMSQGEQIDKSQRIFVNHRAIRFTEMEYAIPCEHGPAAIRRVLDMIAAERFKVPMPIECRVVAGDDALLSPSHERDTTYIAVHQYRGLEWRDYFGAVEEIMRSYGGRPHWGKRHFRTAETLRGAYPRWEDFAAARDELDPGRTFSNEYTDRVLGA